MIEDAESNCRLLLTLMHEHGAEGLGAIHNFFATRADQCCPCCYRSKKDIAMLDKNRNLICRFVHHHDHFGDFSSGTVLSLVSPEDKAPSGFISYGPLNALKESFQRFKETLICEHCNNADAAAKAIVKAPSQFSFTPYEITGFIVIEPNVPHKIDPERAVSAFETAKPQMALISERLRALKRAVEADSFEPLAAAAWRVLQNVKRQKP